MRVLVVGEGAREHALCWRLSRSPSCSAVIAAPGNAGTASLGTNVSLSITDGKAILAAARDQRADLAVIGPEQSIATGVADRLREAGISTFGPSRSAGRLESSKVFAKRFMERHRIPTARATVAHSFTSAERALKDWHGGCVVKADGLAAGKGVVVCEDARAARELLARWYASNKIPGGGSAVLLEEQLTGRELSVFAICDGTRHHVLAAACDYKRAGDGDSGPNTGGMGAYSPPSGFPADFVTRVENEVIEPTLKGLAADGERYIGVLYCGLMWTATGPKVIEYNARFGDPETQVILPRIRGDFARYVKSAADGALDTSCIELAPEACVGVVVAGAQYPERSEPLVFPVAQISADDDVAVFLAASTQTEGGIASRGGRIATVAALGSTLGHARERAYGEVDRLLSAWNLGDRVRVRRDIGVIPQSGSPTQAIEVLD